ncbi:MAG: DUF1003 domain-containing protein [Caldimonas sp.]
MHAAATTLASPRRKASASASSAAPPPTVEDVTRDNIESILCTEDATRQRQSRTQRAVEAIARFCGTMTFLWINLAVFAAWIGENEWGARFDPYPFTFLLFVVSLEAIVLSILVLIGQHTSARESERRHHLDLQINLLSEREMSASLRLTAAIAARLGIDADALEEVVSLSRPTDPSGVMEQIVDAEQSHEEARG